MTSPNKKPLPERVRQRLDELGITAFEAVENANAILAPREHLSRAYVYGFISGRKIKPRTLKGYRQLAAALQCSIAYLKGEVDQPGDPEVEGPRRSPPTSARLAGVVEPGAWRPSAVPATGRARVMVNDPDFAAEDQLAFAVRGSGPFEVPNPCLIGVPLETYEKRRGRPARGNRVILERKTQIGDGTPITELTTKLIVSDDGELRFGDTEGDDGFTISEDKSRGMSTKIVAVLLAIYGTM